GVLPRLLHQGGGAVLRGLGAQRVAAVLHDQRAPRPAGHPRQGLLQHARLVLGDAGAVAHLHRRRAHVVYSALIVMYPWVRSQVRKVAAAAPRPRSIVIVSSDSAMAATAAGRSKGAATPPVQTVTSPTAMVIASGSMVTGAAPTAAMMRP